MKKFKTIDEYIQSTSEDIKPLLEKLRSAIHEASPDASETIKYQIPTFDLFGNLVHFAAFKNHIGFYPGPSGIIAFKKELTEFKTSKGAIQFPYDKPIPYDLITKIVKYRTIENLNISKTTSIV